MLISLWDIIAVLLKPINHQLEKYSPLTLVLSTIATTFAIQKAMQIYQQWDTQSILKTLTDSSIQSAERLPFLGAKIKSAIDKEIRNTLADLKAEVDKARADYEVIESLPVFGLMKEDIKDRIHSIAMTSGKNSGTQYTQYDPELANLLEMVWRKTALTNPMHPDWPLINLMEAEIISMCQHFLHGDRGAPGIVTHGGSTSILEACKSYVLDARKRGIQHPEIVVPESAHIAFEKSAKILHAKLIKVPVDNKTGAADVEAMEKFINKRTCLLVGSAPSFPFGIIDPIQKLGALALKHQLPLHVDACLGGFLTAFAKEAGFNLPACDFSVPGVSSISIDTHKYGQTPKGTSVLLFHPNCKASPTHVHLDWVGGMYVTEGIDGSRSGSDIATTWTVLCYQGRNHYIQATKAILNLQQELVQKINQIDGIYVPYQPQLCVIPIKSRENVNSLLIADRLKKAGWSVNILQTADQQAAGFHFCLTSVHTQQADFASEFIKALHEAVQYAKENPEEKPQGMAKAYGKLEKGVPNYIQERIGQGYVKILNTLPDIPIPGIWALPRNTIIDEAKPLTKKLN